MGACCTKPQGDDQEFPNPSKVAAPAPAPQLKNREQVINATNSYQRNATPEPDSWTYATLSTDGIKLEWEDNKMLASVKEPPHLEKPTATPTARTVSFSPQAQYPVDNSLQEEAAGNGAPRYVPLNQAGPPRPLPLPMVPKALDEDEGTESDEEVSPRTLDTALNVLRKRGLNDSRKGSVSETEVAQALLAEDLAFLQKVDSQKEGFEAADKEKRTLKTQVSLTLTELDALAIEAEAAEAAACLSGITGEPYSPTLDNSASQHTKSLERSFNDSSSMVSGMSYASYTIADKMVAMMQKENNSGGHSYIDPFDRVEEESELLAEESVTGPMSPEPRALSRAASREQGAHVEPLTPAEGEGDACQAAVPYQKGKVAWYTMADTGDIESDLKQTIVMYTTSMRAVRKTFEQCQTVRNLFLTYGCRVDERDIAMDRKNRKELKERMGGVAAPVPRVFVGNTYLGGYEEIVEMNEMEELKGLLEKGGHMGKQSAMEVCGECGNMNYVPCSLCNGSRKLYDDDDGEVFRCPDCNENGLVRCTLCGEA
mmetsp:Transcript_23517/g.39417  ORF Transcript_23517/g.39417 Transcript_23517/m.39417 type:complete len:541 (-) Transcript_23517:576-2198(-)|eukprot:CAMPEP_0198200890 /NCGR_PEP_ID=MMETSP1445-20131203/3787_1 /TAXON_ID=36898 /ORGANISM="Pyramimonas sp., Strain CCMP2087" /LENGTH=540 /DNA_ID=CAMNT_0043871057 /DNA_START=516 /DNA_END=2138 /DNA_ORIENTATION=+